MAVKRPTVESMRRVIKYAYVIRLMYVDRRLVHSTGRIVYIGVQPENHRQLQLAMLLAYVNAPCGQRPAPIRWLAYEQGYGSPAERAGKTAATDPVQHAVGFDDKPCRETVPSRALRAVLFQPECATVIRPDRHQRGFRLPYAREIRARKVGVQRVPGSDERLVCIIRTIRALESL